jgi:hypothetical protein
MCHLCVQRVSRAVEYCAPSSCPQLCVISLQSPRGLVELKLEPTLLGGTCCSQVVSCGVVRAELLSFWALVRHLVCTVMCAGGLVDV